MPAATGALLQGYVAKRHDVARLVAVAAAMRVKTILQPTSVPVAD
jgi:hypothetical protein